MRRTLCHVMPGGPQSRRPVANQVLLQTKMRKYGVISSLLKLPDGRDLHWLSYGQRDARHAQHVILYHHGWPSCALEPSAAGLPLISALNQAHCRLIAINRPGVEHPSPCQGAERLRSLWWLLPRTVACMAGGFAGRQTVQCLPPQALASRLLSRTACTCWTTSRCGTTAQPQPSPPPSPLGHPHVPAPQVHLLPARSRLSRRALHLPGIAAGRVPRRWTRPLSWAPAEEGLTHLRAPPWRPTASPPPLPWWQA